MHVDWHTTTPHSGLPSRLLQDAALEKMLAEGNNEALEKIFAGDDDEVQTAGT